MAKINPFNGFDSQVTSAPSQALPVGTYPCEIIGTKVEATSYGTNQLIIQLEICEGPYTGYYKRNYEERSGGQWEAKYRGVYRVNIPTGDGSERDGWAINKFNKAIGAIEASNKGYAWDWDTVSLKGKKVGIIVRAAEYNGNEYTEIGMFNRYEDAVAGKYRAMKKRGQAQPAAPAAPAVVDTVDDLPF